MLPSGSRVGGENRNFKIKQNNAQILISQLRVEWHCENYLNSLRILSKGTSSKYVYICIGGSIFFSFPYLGFLKLFTSNMNPFYNTNMPIT